MEQDYNRKLALGFETLLAGIQAETSSSNGYSEPVNSVKIPLEWLGFNRGTIP